MTPVITKYTLLVYTIIQYNNYNLNPFMRDGLYEPKISKRITKQATQNSPTKRNDAVKEL